MTTKMNSNAQQNLLIFRYVNVCAAVCLLFLVGSLTPQSLAAPSAMSNEQEDPIWANPCGYDTINNTNRDYYWQLARDVVIQAKNALEHAESYKDEFAYKFHGFSSFNDQLEEYDHNDFWTKIFSLTNITLPLDKAHQLKDVVQKDDVNDEYYLTVPPKTKVYNSKVSDAYLEQLMTIIKEVLPKMYKSLKAVGVGMLSVSKDQDLFKNFNKTIIEGKTLQEKLNETTLAVRKVLCRFSDLMRIINFKVDPILDSEVPKDSNKKKHATVVYQATLNYLGYLEQVFDKIRKTKEMDFL